MVRFFSCDPASVKDYGAFVERFVLAPAPQPPPPAAPHPLADLTFAVSDDFEIEGYVAGFGNPDWKKTHGSAIKTAAAVAVLLKSGSTCIGRTVMDELGFGVTGENLHYGVPVNPAMPASVPGGPCSGSAVAVAANLVDFSLGTDTVGGVRIPASFCGIFGFRPSHGVVSAAGCWNNSQSLDTIGWFARDPSTLRRVGHVLLPAQPNGPKRTRQLIFADDCFQLSRVPAQRTFQILKSATDTLSGYQPYKHINIGQYLSSNMSSLGEFQKSSGQGHTGMSALKALSSAMLLLQRCEFKNNHESWVQNVKPNISIHNSVRVLSAVNSENDNLKLLYKVRSEARNALNTLLKDSGILVIPTMTDFALKRNSKQNLYAESEERMYTLLCISGMSGCCQVTIPLGKQDSHPVSVSFIAAHGSDKFLLDTVSDMFPAIEEKVNTSSDLIPEPDTNGDMDASELLKEKGNAAFKGKQWNKAVRLYSEAIKLNNMNATLHCNRAAAYLELGCFQQAESDCSQAILLDKKNVKAYLRRGTARESLLSYKDALQDFRHALALEPQNKTALSAEKRLQKLVR